MGYWTTALGKRKRFDEISHQHLSNILWFQEVFHGEVVKKTQSYRELTSELNRRCDGKRKLWKPLPIPNEITFLYNRGMINGMDIILNGKKIGSIKHIK